MPATQNKALPGFLQGGGEMGRLIRAFDWSASPLGAPSSWPSSLCNTLGILLHSRFPMFLFWGTDFLCFYNDAYRPSLGREGAHPSALGRPARLVWGDTWAQIGPQIEQVMAGGEATWYENQLIPMFRNGKMENTYWTCSHSPVPEADGRVAGVFVSCSETTAQIDYLDRLGENESFLRFAMEAAELGTYEYDLASGAVRCSGQGRRNLGLAESDLLDFARMTNMILPVDRQAMEQAMATAIRQRTVYQAEYRITLPQGGLRWIRATGRPSYTPEGKPEKIAGILADITEEKNFAAELSKRVIEQTLELHRSNNDLQQFAHVASHDLKEPVRKIKTFVGRIQEEFGDQLPDKARFYLEKVQNAGNRMYHMIDGVLTFSSLNATRQTIETVDLDYTLQQIESDLEVLVQQKEATIRKSGALGLIQGAGVLLYQLLYNLIYNSLKFSRAGFPPEIFVGAVRRADTGTLDIEIRDNGIGFESEYAVRIFDSFVRLNPKDRFEGTGLGLALCKKIVERHHGSISASGEPGSGAVFLISLPLTQLQSII